MDKIKWKTVTYTIVELKPVGGVVIQRDVLEKYKAEHPDEEVKTFAGFKCDQQDKTVSLRIGIADDSITAGTVAKIEPELLQSERDELVALKEKYDELQQELNKTGLTLLDAVKEVEGLKNQLRCNNDVFLGSEKNYLELKEKYDALVEIIGKDAQKFSAMWVENNNLKEENKELNFDCDNLIEVSCGLRDKIDQLLSRLAEIADDDGAKEAITNGEDSADLAEAEKALAEDNAISLDEIEDAVENKELVTDDEKCDCCGGYDCGEVKGSDTDGVDMTEGELDDGTPDCRSDGTIPEDDENG